VSGVLQPAAGESVGMVDADVALAYASRREDHLMRIAVNRVWLPALALIALSCAPWHRHPGAPHGAGMAMACGPDACGYKSKWFSDGAIRSNDGVCQACSGGKWVAATGCHECACHECGGKMGKSAPCDREHHPRRPQH